MYVIKFFSFDRSTVTCICGAGPVCIVQLLRHFVRCQLLAVQVIEALFLKSICFVFIFLNTHPLQT